MDTFVEFNERKRKKNRNYIWSKTEEDFVEKELNKKTSLPKIIKMFPVDFSKTTTNVPSLHQLAYLVEKKPKKRKTDKNDIEGKSHTQTIKKIII